MGVARPPPRPRARFFFVSPPTGPEGCDGSCAEAARWVDSESPARSSAATGVSSASPNPFFPISGHRACRVGRHCCVVCHCIVCHCLLRRLTRTLFRRQALTCFPPKRALVHSRSLSSDTAQAEHRRCRTTTRPRSRFVKFANDRNRAGFFTIFLMTRRKSAHHRVSHCRRASSMPRVFSMQHEHTVSLPLCVRFSLSANRRHGRDQFFFAVSAPSTASFFSAIKNWSQQGHPVGAVRV